MEGNLNIHQKINIRQLAKEFPIIGKKEMGERLRKLKIGVTGEFESSMTFRGEVLVNGVLLEIDYEYYGMFTDMGVGNGITMGDVNVAKLIGSGRKKKNWTRKLAHFRHRLGELYTEVVANEISQHVNGTYDRTLRFKF
jgi:hypothetical protein